MYPYLEEKLYKADKLEKIRLIRSLSLEGLGDYAITRMKELIPLLSNEGIIAILLGDKTIPPNVSFEGIIETDLVDESEEIKTKFQKDLNFIYRGIYKRPDNKFYRPYAFVKSYCLFDAVCKKRQQELVMTILDKHFEYYEDKHLKLIDKEFVKASKAKKTLLSRLQKDILYRVKHYANKDSDIAVWVKNIKAKETDRINSAFGVLCQEVEGVPSFFKIQNKNPACAYTEMLTKYDEIKEYGSNVSYSSLCDGSPLKRRNLEESLIEKHEIAGQYYQLIDAFAEFVDKENKEVMRNQIIERSEVDKHGYVDLKNENGEVLATVARLPLLCWALERTSKRREMPSYEPVSPSGMKMQMDSRAHTDWMISGNLDLEEDYRGSAPVQSAAYLWAHNIQREYYGYEHLVLSSGAEVTGKVKHCTPDNANEVSPGDIVVIPNGSPQYQLHVEAATSKGNGGVIAVVGNRVAHLTKVSRERGITMMQNDNAFMLYPEGMKLTLSPDKGKITITV